jgi:hypothetical protein
MGIAKALTNDLERALRLYRIPILTALAFSFRRNSDDRFLLTDDRNEDSRRNVIRLRRISAVEQSTCKPGVGVDDRQFTGLTGNLLFTGLPDANGIVQPLYNMTNMGGRTDLDGVVFTATGSAEEKQTKIRRYNAQRPGDVNWRIRSPIMMADETSVIDYLAFRCTQLRYLHSISLKWSDRRWDARSGSLDQDLYRVEGERTHMITLAPMWMDENMSTLDPAVWGPFEELVRSNYEEILGRKVDELVADCGAFQASYNDYIGLLTPTPGMVPASVNAAVYGRVARFLDTMGNRTLHVPFNKQVVTQDGNDSYRVYATDPNTATNVTQDVFNLKDADNQWRLTSSFENDVLSDDGWCGTAITAPDIDIPTNLPPYTHEATGEAVYGTKSVQASNGYICRRLALPDGTYAIQFWVKTDSGNVRVEVIRNNRIKTKGWQMDEHTNRVLSIKHWRENYETLTATTVLYRAGWRQVFLTFNLKDSVLVPGEGYPAHEVYIVLNTDGVAHFDHLDLFQDKYGHNVQILNTVTQSTQPFDVRPELTHVNLEKAFQTDSSFGEREAANNFFRIDGGENVVKVEHREAYNLKSTGTTIDTWFKINSDDEEARDILNSRGSFTIFQKTGVYLQGYSLNVDRESILTATTGVTQAFSSRSFRNTMLHPSVGTNNFPARTDWSNPNIYDTFKTAFQETGLQPVEWTSVSGSTTATVGTPQDIGGGKYLLIASNDPYLTGHPGTIHNVLAYLDWHARRAYAMVMPSDQVSPGGTAGGFVFAPIPLNSFLYQTYPIFGNYNPSPAEYSPRFLYSPAVPPFPSPGDLHPDPPAQIFTPADPPSPMQGDLYPVYWPISPEDWGTQPPPWPSDTFLYGPVPSWETFSWQWVFDDASMQVRHPMVVGGKMKFDRWVHFNMAAANHDLEIGLHGFTVYKSTTWDFPTGADRNGDDLLIGTASTTALNVGAPISLYSFKIFQYRMPNAERSSIFSGESINFNELQYNTFKENLDHDFDGIGDFWMDETTDLGLWTQFAEEPTDPYRPYPTNPASANGKVYVSVADPIEMTTDLDRDRNLLADWFNESYLQELIDIQTIGFADGLIFWDFMNPGQAATYDYNDRIYNSTCKTYTNRTISYLDWLRDTMNQEWNSVTAIHDPIPGFKEAGSPSPWAHGSPNPQGPWPTFGDRESELVMTGVKGWFGWNGLLGYRDSLALVAKEGIVFNYLQVEYHFRAPRDELEALLKPYAHGIDQIFDDSYVGNQLTRQTGS